MARPKKLEIPSFMGPINDLIPNEVLYDGYKLNTWVAIFIAAFGLITALETGADKTKEAGMWTLALTMISAPLALADLIIGSSKGGEGVGVMVDWAQMAIDAKADGNELAFAVLTFLSNDFYRRAIMASGVACVGTFSIYDTKMMENLPYAVPGRSLEVGI